MSQSPLSVDQCHTQPRPLPGAAHIGTWCARGAIALPVFWGRGTIILLQYRLFALRSKIGVFDSTFSKEVLILAPTGIVPKKVYAVIWPLLEISSLKCCASPDFSTLHCPCLQPSPLALAFKAKSGA